MGLNPFYILNKLHEWYLLAVFAVVFTSFLRVGRLLVAPPAAVLALFLGEFGWRVGVDV